ncbi:MAG: T9SS type A sorting domain-containing protein [Bacteroidales bacterium]|nr:T9SS type A sorting domain-containing protein [Bacteroidales bacterium]
MKRLVIFCSLLMVASWGRSQSLWSLLFPSKATHTAVAVGNLPAQIEGTSSLFFYDGRLWTANDHNALTLYTLDTSSAAVTDSILIAPYIYDMEEISQDETYIYFGDMGDNNGVRNDLRILRLSKSSLPSGPFLFDTIAFSYPDRTDSTARDFDCEAFIVTDSSIILFTKQWNSHNSDAYYIPKLPGSWSAQYRFSLSTQGMVTGASFQSERRLLVLCGYNSTCSPFVYIVKDFDAISLDTSMQQRVALSNGIGTQIEGIATIDGLHYFLTCERFDRLGISRQSQLFKLDLSDLLFDYLNPPIEAVTDITLDKDCFVVYPNPTSSRLHLPANKIKRYALVDMQKRTLLKGFADEWINLYHLPASTYLLRLTLKDNTIKTITIVKQ